MDFERFIDHYCSISQQKYQIEYFNDDLMIKKFISSVNSDYSEFSFLYERQKSIFIVIYSIECFPTKNRNFDGIQNVAVNERPLDCR